MSSKPNDEWLPVYRHCIAPKHRAKYRKPSQAKKLEVLLITVLYVFFVIGVGYFQGPTIKKLV